MWSQEAIAMLDKWFPPCGPCLLCGYKDKRHRLWDAILDRQEGDEFLAGDYDLPVEAIQAVRNIRPYCRSGTANQ